MVFRRPFTVFMIGTGVRGVTYQGDAPASPLVLIILAL